jgi:hypothetical protein
MVSLIHRGGFQYSSIIGVVNLFCMKEPFALAYSFNGTWQGNYTETQLWACSDMDLNEARTFYVFG